MSRTYIGIDIDKSQLRAVALTDPGSGAQKINLAQREIADDDIASTIETLLESWGVGNARIATAIQASALLTRRIAFPFSDSKKIGAALPLELGTRLPVEIDDYSVFAQPTAVMADKHATIGLAVPTSLLTSTLEPFDTAQLPLRHLAVAPFAYGDGLSQLPQDCILLTIRQDVFQLLLLREGKPFSHRIVMREPGQDAEATASRLHRDIVSLQKAAGLNELPLIMIGSPLNDELPQALMQGYPNTLPLDETIGEATISAEFLPALALANLARSGRNTLNLRQGKFAYRGSLLPFRKQLIAAAMLIVLTSVGLIGGAWFSYARKAAAVDQLQIQIEQIYRQTFPQSAETPKDVLLHMTSRLNELRNKNRLLGGADNPPLSILEAVTRVLPADSTIAIREFIYDRNGVSLAGRAPSFDAVDQLAAKLDQRNLFADTRISDAKMTLDGKEVEFRVELDFQKTGGEK